MIVDDIRPRGLTQGSLFDSLPSERNHLRETLMPVLDKTNGKWGRGTMGIGEGGIKGHWDWTMNRGMLSPAYTTKWQELRVVS